MYSNFYNEKNEYFSIVVVSLTFHFAVVAALVIAVWLRPAKESPPPIPFFEMVNLAPPPPAPSKPIEKPPEPVPEPVPEQPVIKPELKPEIKPDIKPTPVAKPEPPKPEQKANPKPAPLVEPAPQPQMDMEMPSEIKSKDMSMIETVDYAIKDPQFDAYLSTLFQLIYQNFNPPAGTEIAKGTKSTVYFQIARNGEISEVILRSSSGNSIWDRLAMRAVQITKPPPLPPSIAEEHLRLKLNFQEK